LSLRFLKLLLNPV